MMPHILLPVLAPRLLLARRIQVRLTLLSQSLQTVSYATPPVQPALRLLGRSSRWPRMKSEASGPLFYKLGLIDESPKSLW